MSTKIQWTEETWNPIPGCFKVSPGCKNCYAIRQVARMAGNPNPKIASRYFNIVQGEGSKVNWTGKTNIDEAVLLQPLKRKQPTTYFISLSDLFYNARPDEDIMAVFMVMAKCPQHTFQVLTKYPDRMRSFLARRRWRDLGDGFRVPIIPGEHRSSDEEFLPNVWLGVSVESQEYADERIPLLLGTPAALRFVSYEPALGPVDFRRWLTVTSQRDHMLDWVIVGGESGRSARAFDIEWARKTIKQCRVAGIPCFVKQLGAKPIQPDMERSEYHIRPFIDRKGGDPSEWTEELRVREIPEVRHG